VKYPDWKFEINSILKTSMISDYGRFAI